MNKISKIKSLTKKHPSWRKVFLAWQEKTDNIDLLKLKTAFDTLIKHRKLLSEEVTIHYALSLLDHKDQTNRDIVEKFDDKIQEVLHDKKKEQFISSLKTEKYSHLFDSNVNQEIHIILDNHISISALKHQFFNKLARFKNSNELLISLSQFKEKNIGWNKAYYLNKIREENLSAEIFEEGENSLMIRVFNYQACAVLGSQAWCIVESIKYYHSYTQDFMKQYIYFNFNKSLDDNASMIGFTVDLKGRVNSSYLKNDFPTPTKIINQFYFPKVDNLYLKKLLNKMSNEKAFRFICKFDFIEYYHDFKNRRCVDSSTYQNALSDASRFGNFKIVKLLLENKYIDSSLNGNENILVAAENGHLEVVKLLLKDVWVDPSDGSNYAIRAASREGHLEIVKLLLQDKRVDASDGDNEALRFAAMSGFSKVVKILLQDKMVDPACSKNYPIREAARRGNLEVVRVLLRDVRVNPSEFCNIALETSANRGHLEITELLLMHDKVMSLLNFEWIKNNIIKEHHKFFNYALNQYNDNK